jgi:hypothetical protein
VCAVRIARAIMTAPAMALFQVSEVVPGAEGNDVSTYLDGMKARAGRAHARLKSIGVPTP